jgi:hypothetical protein
VRRNLSAVVRADPFRNQQRCLFPAELCKFILSLGNKGFCNHVRITFDRIFSAAIGIDRKAA